MKINNLFCLMAIFMLCACKPVQDNTTKAVPLASEVGDACMPAEIAPIEAPFAMPQLSKPVIPGTTVKLSLSDAPADMQTDYINQQINALSQSGGGTVELGPGVWKSGRIELKSRINLHIPEGTEVHFSGAIKDYQPAVFTRMEGTECLSSGAFIYANGQEDIALTGRGVLVSPGLDCEIAKTFWDNNHAHKLKKITVDMPLEERVFDGSSPQATMYLPKTFAPIDCKNILVEGIRIQGSLTWNIAPMYCENVIIRGVNVNSIDIPTGDGIDIESTRNVLIEYSTLANGDDCYTIKAGRSEDGLRVNKPAENIVIRHCLSKEGHGAVTCGSETAAGIKNLYVHDCVFDGTERGLRFKTRRTRAGGGDSLYYERIRIINAKEAMRWDMLGSAFFMGELASRHPVPEVDRLTPHFRDVFIKDIIVENAEHFIRLSGIPESPAANVFMENCEVTCKELPQFTDVDGLTIKNSTITAQDSTILLVDARNITFDHVKINIAGELTFKREGDTTNSILFVMD
ncbi:glycoside hydrolase family 28 protein [Bacteroides sp. 51]|uniref:glycoside hydrolase family 28 protein n=1 Tax=Bacteroides sp. 51 TaxID=2302938 RepID=UPI0013D4AE1F|nr:glycoside hydrolase family 28 protein [Bacteroides sp. 51]NDV82153.1 glycoside hydrolase family 28 protein [Bacteroides sp. 51]